MNAQHAAEMARLQFPAYGAVDYVGLRREMRQNGCHQTGECLLWDFRVGAEFLVDQLPQTGLRQQFETKTLRSDPRDLLVPASGMARNGDQRHVTCSS
jgi:hypothetical protein